MPAERRARDRRLPAGHAGPADPGLTPADTGSGPAPAGAEPGPFGVYVHVPFCAARCDYCAFATWTDRHHLQERYLRAVAADVARAVAAGMPVAASIFVGGGTPSLVDPDLLGAVVAAIPVAAGAEVTVECNPDDVTVALLTRLRDAGVTRISLGVQSMVPAVLASLGRRHDPAAVRSAVEAIGAVGFSSWNVDLIYGAAGEARDDWEQTLLRAVALDPPHVSAYALTVEAGTPLATEPHRHPDDDDQADKYLLADAVLGGSGRRWYEISNWARPGHECRHNLLYWRQGDYLGFGCAAHSHRAGRRFWNVRTPERYVRAVEEGASAVGGDEWLDDETRALEALQLSLRTSEGVPAAALADGGEELVGLGDLVERVGDRLVLTTSGRLLANELSLRLRPRRPTGAAAAQVAVRGAAGAGTTST